MLVILLMAIVGYCTDDYSISGYWWLFYKWLLMDILLVDISAY
jgi:hypothetical protein